MRSLLFFDILTARPFYENMAHKYSSPNNWLYQKILLSTDIEVIRAHALTLLTMVDNDQIQDIYQREMDLDGYFNQLHIQGDET